MKDELMITTDSYGQIVGFPHHDGRLECVRFGQDNCVSLWISGSTGDLNELRLLGCRLFDASGAREQNIIDRMYFWKLDQVPEPMLGQAARALDIDSDFGSSHAYRDYQLFVLECSYGLSIHALVERAVISRESLPAVFG